MTPKEKRTVIIEVTVICERQTKRESWSLHRVGRVLSFKVSRQICFSTFFSSERGGGSHLKRLNFYKRIYTMVLYFYMYYG